MFMMPDMWSDFVVIHLEQVKKLSESQEAAGGGRGLGVQKEQAALLVGGKEYPGTAFPPWRWSFPELWLKSCLPGDLLKPES